MNNVCVSVSVSECVCVCVCVKMKNVFALSLSLFRCFFRSFFFLLSSSPRTSHTHTHKHMPPTLRERMRMTSRKASGEGSSWNPSMFSGRSSLLKVRVKEQNEGEDRMNIEVKMSDLLQKILAENILENSRNSSAVCTSMEKVKKENG